jgi:hypothetical protein
MASRTGFNTADYEGLSTSLSLPSAGGWLANPAGVTTPGAFDGWSLSDAPVNDYSPRLEDPSSFENPFTNLPGAQNTGSSQLGSARVSSNETTGEDQSNLSTVHPVLAAPFASEVLAKYTKNSPVFVSTYTRQTNRERTYQLFDVPFLNENLVARALRIRGQAKVTAANGIIGLQEEDVEASLYADTVNEFVKKFAFLGSIAATSPSRSSQSGMSDVMIKRQRPMHTANGERLISVFNGGRCETYQWFSPYNLKVGTTLYISVGNYEYPYSVQIDSNGVAFGYNTGASRPTLTVRAFADNERLGVSQVSGVSNSRLLTNNEAFMPLNSDIAFLQRYDAVISNWMEWDFDETTNTHQQRQENVGQDANAIPEFIYERIENGHVIKVGLMVDTGKGSGSEVETTEAAFKRNSLHKMPMCVYRQNVKTLTRI